MPSELSELKKIIPIPSSPIDVDETVLKQNVAALKTEFPRDFLEYSRVYGSGEVGVGPYAWEIWSAFRPSYPKIAGEFHDIMSDVRDALESHDVPLGVFPEPGGLIPFGVRDDVWFTWKTSGNPDQWNVVAIWTYEHDSYQTFEMNFSGFLVALLNRRIKVAGYTSRWNPKTDITFVPQVFSC